MQKGTRADIFRLFLRIRHPFLGMRKLCSGLKKGRIPAGEFYMDALDGKLERRLQETLIPPQFPAA